MTDPADTATPAQIRHAREIVASADRHPAQTVAAAARYLLRFDPCPAQVARAKAALCPTPRRVTCGPGAMPPPT